MNEQKNAGAGREGAGRGNGFSMEKDRGGGGGFGGRPGGGRGRDGKGGGKRDGKGGKGRGRDDREGGGAGSAGYRVSSELGDLEKALTKADFVAQKKPLEEILKALRPLKMTSIEQLDMSTRGKLITSLLRVGRQTKPAEAVVAEGAPAAAAEAAAPEAAPEAAAPEAATEVAAPEAATEVAAPEAGTEVAAPEVAASGAAVDAPVDAAPSEAAAPAPAQAPAIDPKFAAWQDVIYLVGCIWRAVADERRAALAFAASGRPFEEKKAIETLHKTGEWKAEASLLEKGKRTRDAARVHERNRQWAEAMRLYEEAGDLKSALGCALFAKDESVVERLMAAMKPAESQGVLEKAGEWERLMAVFVKRADFESVARLYERAKQFDQAGLAWERAGKLSIARKTYERAKDHASAVRVRELEVKKLIERGDRLGAATIQIAAGQKDAAIETIKGLAGPKAFRFLQKLKLDEEAMSYAKAEIAKAVAENKFGDQARWLELVGETAAAAEAWLKAERKDKALPLYEQLADWPKAAALAEALAQHEKAVELFHRAGDKANAERVAALPKPAAPVPVLADPEDAPPENGGAQA
jgi:tetratricopeptide (TPR) repeat protein